MNLYLSEAVRVSRVMNGQVAGTSSVDGSSVDMAADGGYDGVLFIALFGALTSTQVTKLKAERDILKKAAAYFAKEAT